MSPGKIKMFWLKSPRDKSPIKSTSKGFGELSASAFWANESGASAVGVELSGESVRLAGINAEGVPCLRGRCSDRIPQLQEWARRENGEILVYANPSNPGQSGTQGPPPREDTASHLLLFQTAYSGALNVYVASQQTTLRVNGPIGRVTFHGDFFNPGSGPVEITCLLSISGYIEKQ